MVVIHLQGNENKFAPCQRMATAIAYTLRIKQECFPSDLDNSFTDEELEQHWNMAYALAHVDLMADLQFSA